METGSIDSITISKIVEDWFVKQSFFVVDQTMDYAKYAENLSKEIEVSALKSATADYISGSMKQSILDLVKTLSMLGDSHYLHHKLEKASSAMRKASMFLAMLPYFDNDMPRINADLMCTLIVGRLMNENPTEQGVRLTQNAHAYQKKGVNHYLLMLYHFSLIVGYLKDGNAAQFYNRCQLLRDLISRSFKLSLTCNAASLQVSQVIAMKVLNMPLNSDMYAGIVCFATLFEWLNLVMVDEENDKIPVLLNNAKKLAEKCGFDMAGRVNKIIELVESQIKAEAAVRESKSAQKHGSKVLRRSYSINIQDYDSSQRRPVFTRPTSGSKLSIHRRTNSGSNPAQVTQKQIFSVFVPGLNLEESTAVGDGTSRIRDSRTPETSTYRLKHSGKFMKKEPKTSRDHTEGTISLHSLVFKKANSKSKEEKVQKVESNKNKNPAIPDIFEDYQNYLKFDNSKKECKFELSSQPKGAQMSKSRERSYNKIGYSMSKTIKNSQETPPAMYGSYYLGLHTLQMHTGEMLQLTKNKDELDSNLMIMGGKDTSGKDHLKQLDFSAIKENETPYLSRTNSAAARKYFRSRESMLQEKENQNIAKDIQGGLNMKKVEAMLIRRPGTAKRKEIKSLMKKSTLGDSGHDLSMKVHRTELNGSGTIKEDKTHQLKVEDHSSLHPDNVETPINVARNTISSIAKRRNNQISAIESTYQVSLDRARRVKKRNSVQPYLTLRSKTGAAIQTDGKEIDFKATKRHGSALMIPLNTEEELYQGEKVDISAGVLKPERIKTQPKEPAMDLSYSILKEQRLNFKSQQALSVKAAQQGETPKTPLVDEHKYGTLKHSDSKQSKRLNFQDHVALPEVPDFEGEGDTAHLPSNKLSERRGSSKFKVGAMAVVATNFKESHRRQSVASGLSGRNSRKSGLEKRHSIKQPFRLKGEATPILAAKEELEDHISSEEAEESPDKQTDKSKTWFANPPLDIREKENSDSQSSASFLQVKVQDQTDQDIDIRGPEDLLIGRRREEIFNQIHNFNQSYNVKEDLLKFVQGFHKIRNLLDETSGNIQRMAFFVVRFFPHAIAILKPSKDLEFHRSMIDYNQEYKPNEKEELLLKPW